MEDKFIVRTIRYQGLDLVNVCDADLLGKVVEGDGVKVAINQDYYGGGVKNEDEALELVSKCSIANLAGRRIVGKVLGARLANEQAVKVIGNVPFLMIYKFSR
jgi:hypothetical protein